MVAVGAPRDARPRVRPQLSSDQPPERCRMERLPRRADGASQGLRRARPRRQARRYTLHGLRGGEGHATEGVDAAGAACPLNTTAGAFTRGRGARSAAIAYPNTT